MAFHHNNHFLIIIRTFLSITLPSTTTSRRRQLSENQRSNWFEHRPSRSQQPQPAQPHSSQFSEPNFLNLHTTRAASDSTTGSQAPNQWLSRTSSSLLHRNHSDVIDDVGAAAEAARGGGGESMVAMESGGSRQQQRGGGGGDGVVNWQNARYKADILAHPLCEQLLSAHVACLRVATPVDQLPRIDAQLAQSQHVVAKYSSLSGGSQGEVADDKELDQFLTHYVLLLCSFKEQLQQHVRVHAMEAVMACWEIEQSLQSLTGVSPGEGTGATMSDDDDDQVDSDANLFDGSLEDSEKSLMERVRHELKHELKQGYKEKIVDIREEILRKRRAGKLPGDTTSVLKHGEMVQETGLQLKQINNWFINQRKRNWNSNPSTSTVSKSKRKRSNAGENNGDRFM
ncbi:hypothetical protein V6Z12_1Z007600 [Gossypium hirsutum]